MLKKEKVYRGKQIRFFGKENLLSYGMSLPYLIIFITFNILPIFIAVLLSFTYFNMLQPPTFNGMENYINLLTNDDLFLTGLRNTLIISLYGEIWTGYGNSLIYMVASTIASLFVTICCAYPLSVPGFKGAKLMMPMCISTMYFSGGLIPTYIVMSRWDW